MYSDEDVDTAVTADIFSANAASAFRQHVAARKRTVAVDEENFRLVSSFNDIFVVIASGLLLASVAWIGYAVQAWLGALATCAAAWGLAEFFVRKRHMALPSIVLLGAFVGGVFFTVTLVAGPSSASMAIGSSIAALAAWLHWRRFKVPITVAAGVAAIIGAIALSIAAVPEAKAWLLPIVFAGGVACFSYAFHWDTSDARRQTRRSDVAFWLHLLAAPLLVHPVFSQIGVLSSEVNAPQTALIVALYFAIACVSLAIDRRALMVSALGYVLYTFTALLKNAGFVSLSFAITALIIGSALLLLSAFWHKSRVFVVQLLPSGIRARLASLD